MSYKFLDHATDAFVEVTAKDLKEAFAVTADAVINITIDQDKVQESDQKEFSAQGKDLRYLLFSWLEEITFVLITEGFAIRRIEFDILENNGYSINAKAFGETLDLQAQVLDEALIGTRLIKGSGLTLTGCLAVR